MSNTTYSRPPGPSWPVTFQTLYWIFKPVSMLHRLRKRYGDTFTIRLLSIGHITMTADPAEIRKVFTAKADHLHAGEANIVLRPIVGSNSVLLLDGDPHMRHRRLLLPPFHGERMRDYLDAMADITNDAIDGWRVGSTFPMRSETTAITMNIILRVVFGITDPVRAREFYEGMQSVDPNRWFKRFAFAPLAHRIPGLGKRLFNEFEATMSSLNNLIMEEIADRRAQGDTGREDMLSMLLQARDEDGNPMTDQELRDELVTLVVAGHETTATALAWTFELMLRHPSVWRTVVNEAHEGGSDYVDAVVKESLRMRPIIPIIGRRIKQPIEIAGHTLPPGGGISPNIFLTHYREATYPNATSFSPERWEGINQPDGSSWLPFGGGIRRCIGASFALFEMRVVIQEIAKRVELRLERDAPEQIVRRAITFAPGKDVPVVIDDVRAPSSERKRTSSSAAA